MSLSCCAGAGRVNGGNTCPSLDSDSRSGVGGKRRVDRNKDNKIYLPVKKLMSGLENKRGNLTSAEHSSHSFASMTS